MRRRDIIAAIRSIRKAREQINKINEKYPKKYKDEVYLVGDSIITQWYSQYEPIMYDRVGSLYKAFKVNLRNDEISVDFDPSFMKRDKANLIFNNSFMEGYHGGADKGIIIKKDIYGKVIYTEPHPHPGIPYWQTPIPTFGHWGRPALRSFSPYKRMVSQMNKKIEEIHNEQQAEFDEAVNKVEKAINRLFE